MIVTVHYEMYDGVPILSKWITITGSSATNVSVYSVEFLALNQPWSIGGLETDTITGRTDAGKNYLQCMTWIIVFVLKCRSLFLVHVVCQPNSLIQSCFVRHASLALSAQTSPSHRFKYKNFIFGTDLHLCPPYTHIKMAVIFMSMYSLLLI